MSFGVNFSLTLGFVLRDGSTTTSLGSVKMPTNTATELNASGGGSVQLQWADVSNSAPEVLASAPLGVVPGLKGSLS